MGVCCRKSAVLGAVIFLVLFICHESAGEVNNTASLEQPIKTLKEAQEAEERSDAYSNQGVDIPKDVNQEAERRMSLWDFFLSNNNNNQRNANDPASSFVQTQQPQTQIQQPNPNQVILVRNSAFPNPSGGLISRMLLARRMSRLQRIAARLQVLPLILGLMQGSQLQQSQQQIVPQQRQLLSQRIGRQQYREYNPSDILLDGFDFKNASSDSQRHFTDFGNGQFFNDGGYQQNTGYQKARDATFFRPDDFPDPQQYYQAHSAYDPLRNSDQDDGLNLKPQDQSRKSQRQLQQQQQIQLDKLSQQLQQKEQLQRQYPDQHIYEKEKQPEQIFDGKQQQKDIFKKQQRPQLFDQQQDQQKLQQQLLDYVQQLRQQQESQQQQQQQLLDQQEQLKQELFPQRQQQLQVQQQQQIFQQPPVQQQQIFQQPPVQQQQIFQQPPVQQQQIFQQSPVQQQEVFQPQPLQREVFQQQPVQQQVIQQQIGDPNQFPDGSGKVAGDREGLVDLGASLNLGGGNGLQLSGGSVAPGVNVGTNIGSLGSLLTAAAPLLAPVAPVPLFPLGLLPKPMLNLNGRVIFGAELGKGVGLKTTTRR